MSKSRNWTGGFIPLALGFFLLLASRDSLAQFQLRVAGFSALGGRSSSANHNLLATAGQPHPIGASSNANFTLSPGFIPTAIGGVPVIPTVVRVVESSASPGSTASISIELVAQGNENGLGFSLTFDPSILINPQATLGKDASAALLHTNSSQIDSGRYGSALALPAGQTFAAGTHQIVIVAFTVNDTTSANSTVIGFADRPIVREVVNDNADPLPAVYTSGTVDIIRGYEADVAPRPTGNNNGTITIADWVQVGRFAAFLDTVRTDVNEFQRADCAPKATLGNGAITIADWVQAGRYAAGLDAVRLAGGPAGPASTLAFINSSAKELSNQVMSSDGQRIVRVVNATFESGKTDSLIVELEAQGNENALGFSLNCDPRLLTFLEVRKGNSGSDATRISNISQKDSGRVGIALALPAGQEFVAGTHQIAKLVFSASSKPSASATTIKLEDKPISSEVVDVNANILPVIWSTGTVTIEIPTAVEEITDQLPSAYELGQNYPNPFNPKTTISYTIPVHASDGMHVTLRIYNLQGQLVRTLVDELKSPGRYRVVWDGRNNAGVNISSGIYLYAITAGDFKATKKMAILK